MDVKKGNTMKRLYKRFEFEFKYTALVITICVVVWTALTATRGY